MYFIQLTVTFPTNCFGGLRSQITTHERLLASVYTA